MTSNNSQSVRWFGAVVGVLSLVFLTGCPGINIFDTADIYSDGLSEEILGKAIQRKRNDLLISTKATFRRGKGLNDVGSSRHHLLEACDASLRRLGIDHIDMPYTAQTVWRAIQSGKARGSGGNGSDGKGGQA